MDALVYIHHVQSNDNLTGVSIRYGCQPAVVRQANGFWPSDTIQSRRTIVLPVEACTLKGRRLPPTERTDLPDDSGALVGPFKDSKSTPPGPAFGFAYGQFISQDNWDPAATQTSGKGQSPAPPWKHECWVQIDGFSSAVEIGRVPRRTLGFFPRA